MELYIPENLRRIKVIEQLCILVSEYANYFEVSPEDSFNDYEYFLNNDPVKKFLGLCISEEDFNSPESKWDSSQDYDTVINYISRLFYSVKGTRLVLEYMKTYLDLDFVGDITYSPGYIEFSLRTLNINDESVFRDYLEDFLNALLFYEVLNVNIGKLNLVVDNTITSYIQGGVITYVISKAVPISDEHFE